MNLRMEIGFVFQSFNLYPHKTALENVTLAPIHVRGLPKAERRGSGRALLEKVGLADRMQQLSPSALGRPAAARGDRPLALHAAQDHAIR